MGRLQRLVIAAGEALDLGEIAGCQQFEMLFDDQQRQAILRAIRHRLELQGQTFLRTAGANTGRIEALDVAERDFQFLELDLVFRRQGFPQFFQW